LDKTITTAFLIIAGVVSAVALFSAVYPAVILGGDALRRMEGRVSERLSSQIEIIHATQDPVEQTEALVWVKNVGSLRIRAIENCDVFFGLEGDFGRASHGSGSGTLWWTWVLEENGSDWDPTTTLKITIHDTGGLSAGRYFVKVTIPNGIDDEYYFSID
jgi:hypothetical protein